MTASANGTVEAPGTNVAQKAGMNRGMLDKGHGMLLRFIEEVAASEGKRVILVNPRNTSRECALCHHIDGDSRSDAVFRCTACEHEAHADLNASEIILDRARNQIAAIVQGILDELIPPVERRCQPVERGKAPSMNQEARAARPRKDPMRLDLGSVPSLPAH